MIRPLLFIAFSVLLAGCATVPPKPPPSPVAVTRLNALVRLAPEGFPLFEDDLDAASLRAAARQSAGYFRSLPADSLFALAGDTYTPRDFAESMDLLAELLERAPDSNAWLKEIPRRFAVYQSVGTDANRSVTFSSYFEPTIHARLEPSPTYRFPLYARPEDLVDVDLGLFDPAYQGAKLAGRRVGKELVPYHTRADIDSQKILKGRRLEIAWAKDPFEVLDLQIEGTGWLDLGNGQKRRIRYDGSNGKRYRSVGQHLISSGRIPAKTFSRAALKSYLRSHPDESQSLLNVNERYIFFRVDSSTMSPYALGNIQVPLTAGRSIATDPKLFPKGALAWISVEGRESGRAEERVSGRRNTGVVRSSAPPLRRFVLNQDEGGAIQGPGRVDLFAGSGADAEQFASHFWQPGWLYFLVKKKN